MDDYEAVKMRLKSKRKGFTFNKSSDDDRVKYVNNLITRILLAFIVFLGLVIAMNVSDDVKNFIKDDVYKNNISFSKVSNLYNKYFGNVIPIKQSGVESKTVFNESISYKEIKDYKDGYELEVDSNYVVPVIKSGIVVFMGEKEGYGKTIIIQGMDEVDYWYGNVENASVGLYDYVSSGSVLANAAGNKLYLVFQKSGEYLSYDEVVG